MAHHLLFLKELCWLVSSWQEDSSAFNHFALRSSCVACLLLGRKALEFFSWGTLSPHHWQLLALWRDCFVICLDSMSLAEAIWRSSNMVKDEQDKQHGEGTRRGKSNHAGDLIGNFKVDTMAACIADINYWESKAKAEGKDKPNKENSRNKIFKWHGLSPSTLSI